MGHVIPVILTEQDIANFIRILDRVSYDGLGEAKVGVVLEVKLRRALNPKTDAEKAAEVAPPVDDAKPKRERKHKEIEDGSDVPPTDESSPEQPG